MAQKFDVDVKDGALHASVDLNEDGEKLLDLKLYLAEGLEELLKKGAKKEDVKVVDFDFSMQGLKLVLDTDQDGEHLLELNLSIAEALDESGILS
jgi:hypothetical protein